MSFNIHTKATAPQASVSYMEAMEQHVGFVPNLMGVMAESPAAIAAVISVNQALEQSALSPVERRIVTVTACAENNCTYCVPAQSTLAKMEGMPDEILSQIRSKQDLADEKFDALHRFTLMVIENKGWVPDREVENFIASGYQTRHVLEVTTLIALMTLTNYVSHMAGLPLDDAFIPQQWSAEQKRSA